MALIIKICSFVTWSGCYLSCLVIFEINLWIFCWEHSWSLTFCYYLEYFTQTQLGNAQIYQTETCCSLTFLEALLGIFSCIAHIIGWFVYTPLAKTLSLSLFPPCILYFVFAIDNASLYYFCIASWFHIPLFFL